MLLFDKCPPECGHVPWWINPESILMNQLVEGNCLFIFDWEGYIYNHGHIRATTTPSASEQYIKEFPSVFNKQGFDKLTKRRPWDHAIELTPGSKPVDCKVYPLNLNKQKALDEFLEENL